MVKNNLKKILENRGIKNKYIAEKVGISGSHFSNIVNGKTVPNLELALKIAKIMKVPVEKLFALDNE